MNTITFHTENRDGWLRRGVNVSSFSERTYYLEVPQQYAEWVTARNDFLIVLILHALLAEGGEFYIQGEADARLLRQLEEYSRIWHLWCPDTCKRINMKAERVTNSLPDGRDESIAAFSGGVDACYNLYGHEHKLFGAASQKVKACIMIHGADIQLDKQEDFDLAYSKAEGMLKRRGIELAPVRTNLRQYPHDWEMCFNEVVVAALMMFSARYAQGSCGAGTECSKDGIMIPWSHNYITDHLLYPSYFSVYIAGASVGRTERCSCICHDPEFMNQLRVCWQVDAQGGNCGVCEKCQRTMLNFMAVGYKGELPFPADFSLPRFKTGKAWNKAACRMHEEILSWDEKVSHALPEDVRKAIQSRLNASYREQKRAVQNKRNVYRGGVYACVKKTLINLIPVASWRRRLRRKHFRK